MEEWRDIGIVKGIDYKGYYQVSNLGNVRGLDRIVINKKNYNYSVKGKPKAIAYSFGYPTVLLSKIVRKQHRVSRLVAEAFIPNPKNKRTVNHINGIKSDNRVENLEWMTHSENTQHALRTGLMDNLQKKVLMLNLDNEPLKIFDSQTKASRQMNIGQQGISACCYGRHKTAGGYKWKFYKDEKQQK